ncbi:MAG: hypothetical protein ABJH45_13155 [Paracoccaceae bacterium]
MKPVQNADVFVLTLVLTEGWVNQKSGQSYALCPVMVIGDFNEQDALAFTSNVFLRDYVFEFRKKHFFTAREMAAAGPFMIVPPPIIFDRIIYMAFRIYICQSFD